MSCSRQHVPTQKSQHPQRHSNNLIVGTRPQQWRSSIKPRVAHASTKHHSTAVKPSRASILSFAAKKSAPFSLSVPTRPKSITSPNPDQSFAPVFLNDIYILQDKENLDDTEPWVSGSSKHHNSKSGRKTGPLQQRLAYVRASMKADTVRLSSGLFSSIQDPRKGKPYIDVHLIGDPATHGLHTIVLGRIKNWWAWIIFSEKIIPGERLRIYDPLPLELAVRMSNDVTSVVICSQLLERLDR